MNLKKPIAERRLDLIGRSGKRIPFTVQFGPTYPDGKDFRCPVKFIGWGDSPPDIWGVDSLQAFLLAVGLVYGILADFVHKGGRVLWPDTDVSFDFHDIPTLSSRKGRPNKRFSERGRSVRVADLRR